MGILIEWFMFLGVLAAIAVTLAVLIYVDHLVTRADNWLRRKIEDGRRKNYLRRNK